jgi:hypothetical protein
MPYRRPPAAPRLGVICADGVTVLDEDGRRFPLAATPAGYRVYGSWERIGQLWGEGIGEALCWQHQPLRWRPQRSDAPWNAPGVVNIIRVIGWPEDDLEALDALDRWRAWLLSEGAVPAASLGSTSFSLLRARLRRPLHIAAGWERCGPPFDYVLGGRQELVAQYGTYAPAAHYDLPAAYAYTLAHLRYGGHWVEVGPHYPLAGFAARGGLGFIRARVRVPSDLPLGPLPRRPRRRPRRWSVLWSVPDRYPVGKVIQGVWTWEELEAAADAGCKIKRLQTWLHVSPTDWPLPFMPWWEAVERGRELPGYAGRLAKATGNALWGQFCVARGAARTAEYWDPRPACPHRYRRPAPLRGQPPWYAPDLAETITGQVRAALYRAMMLTGPGDLLCAHTDGFWSTAFATLPGTWRFKAEVERLDVLGPQILRYWERGSEAPVYTVAGAPPTLAPRIFESAWRSLQERGVLNDAAP